MASRVRFAEVDGPAFDSGGASYHLGNPITGYLLLYMSRFAEYTVKGRQRRTRFDARAAMQVEVQAADCGALRAAGTSDQVSTDFHNALARSPEMAVAVAAIKVLQGLSQEGTSCGCQQRRAVAEARCCAQALTNVIQRSKAQTMMGLEKELKEAAASLER